MKNGNVNVVICPPCGESTAKSGVRGAYKATSLISPSIGPADHFLRKGGRNGFTLIELLVVVLIIGILAAVAVPQYQKAVRKSRLVQGLVIVRALHEAQEAFYLANGHYATSQEELDVKIECPEKLECMVTENKVDVHPLSASYTIAVVWRHNHSTDYPKLAGQFYCWADKSDEQAVQICKSMGTNYEDSSTTFKAFLN